MVSGIAMAAIVPIAIVAGIREGDWISSVVIIMVAGGVILAIHLSVNLGLLVASFTRNYLGWKRRAAVSEVLVALFVFAGAVAYGLTMTGGSRNPNLPTWLDNHIRWWDSRAP